MIARIISAALVLATIHGSDIQRGLRREARSKGPLPVLRAGKWGYIDHTGKITISPRFEVADFFYEGLAAVRLNEKSGFIDPSGKLVISAEFTSVSNFRTA